MKLSFPVETDNGLKSEIYGNFGDAPGFIIYDTETKEAKYIDNADLNHEPNNCNASAAFGDEKVNGIILSGIGPAPMKKLQNAGIQVLRANIGTVEDNINFFHNGQLICLTANLSCSDKSFSCMCDCSN